MVGRIIFLLLLFLIAMALIYWVLGKLRGDDGDDRGDDDDDGGPPRLGNSEKRDVTKQLPQVRDESTRIDK